METRCFCVLIVNSLGKAEGAQFFECFLSLNRFLALMNLDEFNGDREEVIGTKKVIIKEINHGH